MDTFSICVARFTWEENMYLFFHLETVIFWKVACEIFLSYTDSNSRIWGGTILFWAVVGTRMAVVYTGFWAWGGVPAAIVPFGGGVLFSLGKAKISRFCKLENFQKCFKNQWKNYKFLEILRKFCDFLKILSKFSEKFREKFRKFAKYGHVETKI